MRKSEYVGYIQNMIEIKKKGDQSYSDLFYAKMVKKCTIILFIVNFK